MLDYFKKSIAYTVAIFLFLVVIDLIIASQVDWVGDVIQSLVMAFVVIPFADCLLEMLKLK